MIVNQPLFVLDCSQHSGMVDNASGRRRPQCTVADKRDKLKDTEVDRGVDYSAEDTTAQQSQRYSQDKLPVDNQEYMMAEWARTAAEIGGLELMK